MSEHTLLRVQLRAGYGRRSSAPVLRDVAFEIQRGERFGLVGLSGAGKSTLVLALLGMLPWRGGWTVGEVFFEGVNLLAMPESEARALRGRRIALVPQSPMSALNPLVSLRRHFEQAWRAHQPSLNSAFEDRLREVLAQVQLPNDSSFLVRRPGAISVGQAQRVVLALALLHRPSLVIADEATSALDPCTQAEIVAMLRAVNRSEETSVLYISHDLLSVLQFCGTLAVLDAGSIVECVEVKRLLEKAGHPLTAALIRTLPAPLATILRCAREKNAEPGGSSNSPQASGEFTTFSVFHRLEPAPKLRGVSGK